MFIMTQIRIDQFIKEHSIKEVSMAKSADEIYQSCKKVYGTCTDGSFEMCLSFNDYYNIKAVEDEQISIKVQTRETTQSQVDALHK
jgi:hypothetical protein